MQRDTKQDEQNVPYTCMEDKVLDQINDTIIQLVRESLRIVPQLEIVAQREVEDEVVSQNVRNLFKKMLQPAVFSTLEDWEKSNNEKLTIIKDLPAQDWIIGTRGIYWFLAHFQNIRHKSMNKAIAELVQQGIQNITNIEQHLPNIQLVDYLIRKVIKKIKGFDVVEEIVMYKQLQIKKA